MLLSSVPGALRRSVVFLASFLVVSVSVSVRAQSAADGYDPEVTGSVQAMALQPNGKLVVGGAFSQIQPRGQAAFSPASGLARLNADGSIDSGFAIPTLKNANNTQLPALVNAVTLQPDGKILVGGNFTAANGQSYLARFNADGTVDASFAPVLTGTVNGEVTAIALQSNANDPAGFSILVGGNFNQVSAAGSGFGRSHLARLSSRGAPDAFWNPNVSAQVDAIAIEKSGTILIGGAFTSVAGVVRNHVARINADAGGTLDPSYNPNATGQVRGIAIQSDGKAVIVGSFTSLQPQLADGSFPSTASAFTNIARLNADGTLDPSWTGTTASAVSSVLIEQNGGIVVAGIVGTLTGGGLSEITSFFARFLSDGTPDYGFQAKVNGAVDVVVEQPNGDLIIGGTFTQVRSADAPHATPRLSVARVTPDGTFDVDFNPNAFGGVGAIAAEPGGSYLIAGSFTSVGGISIRNLARIKSDGSLDTSFTPSPDGTVTSVVEQSDGKIIIGGSFVQPTPSVSTTQRPNLARLNHDGSLDTAYDPEPNSTVLALVLQSSGKLLVGGGFSTFFPNGATTAVGENFIARLNTDGTVDTTFSPFAGGAVSTMAIDSTGNYVIVGGAFTSFTPTASKGISTTTILLARLNLSDGSVDTTFAPNPNQGSQINVVALQADGKILVGGQFQSFLPPSSPIDPKTGNFVPTPRRNLLRLNKDGTIDSFAPNPDGPVYAVAADQNNGQVYVGGTFKNIAGKFQPYLARLNSDGTIDKHDTSGFSGFGVQLNGPVTAIVPLTNHQFVAGGAFTQAIPFGLTTAVPASHVALFDADGSIDPGFQVTANFNAQINTITFDPNGRVLVGGNFSNIGGTYASDLAQFWGDAVSDSSFGADPNGPINTVLVQGSAIYVGGAYTVINSKNVSNFSRIDSSGVLDTTFVPSVNGPVYASAPDASGNIFIGGAFTQVSGLAHAGLARLTALGSSAGQADASFAPSVIGTVLSVAVQADGKLLVGGAFTAISGTAVTDLARLNSDGTVDTSFRANLVGTRVDAIGLEPDGSIVVGGLFTSAGGVSQVNLARLSANGAAVSGALPAPNGEVNAVALENSGSGAADSILLGGAFTTVGGVTRNHVARITYSGATPSLDPGFDPNADGPVAAIAMNPDGRIFLGGSFRNVGGLPRAGIARLQASGQSYATLTSNSRYTDFTFTLTGEVPELATVAFQGSSDGSNWTGLGLGTRVGNTNVWTITGAKDIPVGTNGFYVQALMDIPTSQYASRAQATWVTRFNATPVPSLISTSTPNAIAGQPFYYEIAATNTPTLYTATGLPPGITLTDAAHGILAGTVAASAAGKTYNPVITITNATGTTSITFTITVAASAAGTPVSPVARLVNLSARAYVSPNNPLVSGFVLSAPNQGTKSLLLRAIGPGLTPFGVSSVLAVPQLTLIDSHSVPILMAQGWDNSSTLRQITASVGAFPLTTNTADTSVATSLADGQYTMSVATGDGTGGVALAEIYDADPNPAAVTPRLVNISAHAQVDAGDPLVAGFVITGTGPKKIIIRGVGPALASFGVSSPLADPALKVYSGPTVIASNTQWETQAAIASSPFAIATVDTLKADSAHSGAFALTSGSADTSLEITLTPGAYTAQVATAGGNSGTALVEIYEVLP